MQYSFQEIHALNLLSDNPEYAKRFNTPPDLKIMTGIILVVVAVALVCAIIFKVDKIVPAQGVLETQAKLFQVRSPSSGFIKTIHVDEGSEVSSNTTLITFDTELMELEISQLKHELDTVSRAIWTDYYQIQEWLTEDALEELSYRLDGIPNSLAQLGYKEYLQRSLRQSLDTMTQTEAALETREAALRRQVNILYELSELETAELARMRRLQNQGIESQQTVDAQQRVLFDIKSNQESLTAELENTRTDINKLKVERAKLQDDFVIERLMRIQDQLDQYFRTVNQLSSRQRELRDMTVRAPFEAVVDKVLARGQNEVIDAGNVLVELRPKFDQDDLEIEIQIPSNYAIWVEPGMEFRASSLGNNPEDHGRLHGVVGFVSESSEVIDGNRIYRMTGQITRLDIVNPDTFLRPGLQLNVEIKAGERRLISYIFDPFTKHLRTALSEPS